MSDELRGWLSQELDRRGWSQGELARQAGVSRPFVTRVLSGDSKPSINFCTKVAKALDEPLDKVLKLAGILSGEPDVSELVNSPIAREILQLIHNMTPSQRKEALRYLRYLDQSNQDE